MKRPLAASDEGLKMKSKTIILALLVAASGFSDFAVAQAVSQPQLGATVEESARLSSGWSRKSILGNDVVNDAGERVGSVADLIVDLENNASFIILNVSDFVGVPGLQVAVPTVQIKEKSGRMLLPGATKEVVRQMPAFRSATVAQKQDRLLENAQRQISDATVDIAVMRKTAGGAERDIVATQRLVLAEKYLGQSNRAYADMTADDSQKSSAQERKLKQALARLQRAIWMLHG